MIATQLFLLFSNYRRLIKFSFSFFVKLSARFFGRILGLIFVFYLSTGYLVVFTLIFFLSFFLMFSVKQLNILLTEKNETNLISLFSPVNSSAILGILSLLVIFFQNFTNYLQISFKKSEPIARVFFHTFTSTVLLLFVKSGVKYLGCNCEFLNELITQFEYIYTVILGHINIICLSSNTFALASSFVQDSFEVFLICTHTIYVCVHNCLCPYELYLYSEATDNAWKLQESLPHNTVCLSNKDSQDIPAESGNGFSTPPRANSPVGGSEDFTTPPGNMQPLREPPALNQSGAGSRNVDTSRNAAGQRIVDPRDVYMRHLRAAADEWNRRNGTGLRDDVPLHLPEPDDPSSIADDIGVFGDEDRRAQQIRDAVGILPLRVSNEYLYDLNDARINSMLENIVSERNSNEHDSSRHSSSERDSNERNSNGGNSGENGSSRSNSHPRSRGD